MASKPIKEATGFVSSPADNWLIAVSNRGPEKTLSISFVKYVPEHTVEDDGVTIGPVTIKTEVMGTFTLSETTARELAHVIPKFLDNWDVPPKS